MNVCKYVGNAVKKPAKNVGVCVCVWRSERALSNQNLLHQNKSDEEKMCKIFKLCRYERFDAQQSLYSTCQPGCICVCVCVSMSCFCVHATEVK